MFKCIYKSFLFTIFLTNQNALNNTYIVYLHSANLHYSASKMKPQNVFYRPFILDCLNLSQPILRQSELHTCNKFTPRLDVINTCKYMSQSLSNIP